MINNKSNSAFAMRAVISSILLIALIMGIVLIGNYHENKQYNNRHGAEVGYTSDRFDFTEPATEYEFDFAVGRVKINTTDQTPYMTIEGNDALSIEHSYSNGKYTVSTDTRGVGIESFFNRLSHGIDVRINVFLPEDRLDSLELDVSAGDVSIERVCANNAELQVSAGSLKMSKCIIRQLKSELSAGKMELNLLSDIEMIEASVSAGNMDLNLSEDIGSFDLYYEKTAGNIDDNTSFDLSGDDGNNFRSSGKKSYRKGDAEPIQIKLDVSAGNITIDDYKVR